MKILSAFGLTMAILLLSACQTTVSTTSTVQTAHTETPTKPEYTVYLAGPEVFLPDPIGAGVSKKAKIASLSQQHNWPFTLVGLYPMDNEIKNFQHDFKTGIAIYNANIELMQKANFVTANMVRFRGPSMDVGTAFEMGYMLGLGKPVFAYYDAKPFYQQDEKPGIYKDKVTTFYPISATKKDTDAFGQSIENFQMADNLMMIGALESGSGRIAESFEEAILQVAEHIKKTQQMQPTQH